jgi:exodeoxyribonuclease-3
VIDGITVGCLYLPNGNPAPRPKFDYELCWFARLTAYAKSFLSSDASAVLAGDYNVMPTELDVYAPERWVDDALFRPETGEAYHRLLAQGWTDTLRDLHPGERIHTFWDYWRNAFGRNDAAPGHHHFKGVTGKADSRRAPGTHWVLSLDDGTMCAELYVSLAAFVSSRRRTCPGELA